ncbi:MAG TPA: YihY/virulence factor BrkB family protein [Sphingobacteriaceae bacterium]|nr:YihY/virulence factor BrkB family protein [Sphingobacteriaceae bacterium]
MKKSLPIRFIKTVKELLGATYTAFDNDSGLKLSAALAYYTVFALAPLLMIIIYITSNIFGTDAVQGRIFSEMNDIVGNNAALQIQETIEKISMAKKSTFAIATGVVTLLFGATGVFVEIQDSINMIWKVKAKPKKGWLKLLTNRILSFSMIISLGFLLIVSLLINGIVVALTDQLNQYFPDITVLIVNLLNLSLTYCIITILFAIIFKFLPDVEIEWKDVRMGALFTAALFMIGRYLISLYIQTSGPDTVYGAAGSLIIVLLWVYYTAAILYFGAEFTQVHAEAYGCKIKPASYAVHIIQTEQERQVKVLPSQDHDIDKKDLV